MSTKLRGEADRSKLPEMVGAVIYVRVSTKEQTENLSLPTQLKACEEYCERQGPGLRERVLPSAGFNRRSRRNRPPAGVLPDGVRFDGKRLVGA